MAKTVKIGDVSNLLAAVKLSIDANEYGEALRLIDRAWRIAPQNLLTSELYMRLLVREGFPDQALFVRAQLAHDRAPPAIAAIEIDALRILDRHAPACVVIAQTVAAFAIVPGNSFTTACRSLIGDLAAEYAGWVGITPDLLLTGDIRADKSVSIVTLECSPDHALVDLVVTNGWASLEQAASLAYVPGCKLRLDDGRKLIGSELHVPAGFGLNLRIDTLSDGMTGELGYAWHPIAPRLRHISRDSSLDIDVIEIATSPGRFAFEIKPGLWQRITQATAELVVDLPDGLTVPLPGSPFPLTKTPAFRPTGKSSQSRHGTPATGDVAIVLPVYSGVAETRACLESVFATTPESVPIVIVNDASPDPALARLIQIASGEPRVTVVENEHNLGFPASVNKGLAVFPGKHAIILNADTVVFGNWLERLVAHARDETIGTITPLTNAGSIASYPDVNEAACTLEQAAHFDELAQWANRHVTVDVPTGVGFCMFIRRDVLDQIGGFDDKLFALGYGEENDFCMRASAGGWRHVIAADVYVQHAGGASFGHRKAGLMSRNAQVLAQRHPGYPAQVAQWLADDPLIAARRNLDIARLAERKGPQVLLVSLAGTGGVARHVDERAQELAGLGCDPILLRPTADGKVAITLPGTDFHSLVFDAETELAPFKALINRIDLAHIEVHHFLGIDSRFVETLLMAGKPIDFVIHDYGWYCSRVNLIDDSNRYCGERGPQSCRECHLRLGAIHHDSIAPAQLKERSARWLAHARRITVPSADTQRRYAAQFPDFNFTVAQWQTFKSGAPWRRQRNPDAPIKVALLGAIGEHKGYRMLLDCARHAALNDLPLEFVVIGFTQDDVSQNMARQPLGESGLVHVTGEYDEAELDHLIERERPDLFLFLSVAPETWCYTLTAAMRTGLPIVAIEQGAIGERLHAGYPLATLIEPTANAAHINDVLVHDGKPAEMSRARKPAPRTIVQAERQSRPQPEPAPAPAPTPALAPQPPVAAVPAAPAPTSTNKAIEASADILNLAKGLYLFTVPRTQPGANEPLTGHLPALQITPGPGATHDDYQIISATATDSHWMTREGDSLVLKVKAAVTTVVIIVLYRAGRPPLKIEVSKLDGETLVSTEPEPEPAAEPIVLQPQPMGMARGPQLAGNGAQPPQMAFGAAAAPGAAPSGRAARAGLPAIVAVEDNQSLRCQIIAHVENMGDAIAFDRNWAGAGNGENRIEAYSIMPMLNISPHAIEYMALTATGMETPWLDQGRGCGTRGLATPLIGFAVRPKPGPSAARFTCEYYGYFGSGLVVGPMRDGALCQSHHPDDPLVGLWVQVMDGDAAGDAARPATSSKSTAGDRPSVGRGGKRKSSIFS